MIRDLRALTILGVFIASGGCAGGGSSDAPRSCSADAQCSAGARCLAGACQYPFNLTIVSPAGRTATNGALDIQVNAQGGPDGGPIWRPESVELVLVNEKVLATVGPPSYAMRWNTLESEDGTHQLKARVTAGGQVYESLSVEVVVDHVPPSPPQVEPARSPRNERQVTLAGMLEEKSPSVVKVYDGQTFLVSTHGSAGGAWTAVVALAEGTHVLAVTATDEAGNESPRAERTVVVDLTPPESPGFDQVVSPSTTNSLILSGTAEPFSTVEVKGVWLPS